MTALATTFATGHVGLNVADLDRSVDFYAGIFGWAVKGRGDGYAFLGDDDRLILTLWQQSDGTFATDRPGLHHLSFEVDSVEARPGRRGAGARGGPASSTTTAIVPHGEGASSGGIFFEDPDGIRLEIFTGAGVHGTAPDRRRPDLRLLLGRCRYHARRARRPVARRRRRSRGGAAGHVRDRDARRGRASSWRRSPGSCSAPPTRRPHVGDRALRPPGLHHACRRRRRSTSPRSRCPATRSPARSTARSAGWRSSPARAAACASTAAPGRRATACRSSSSRSTRTARSTSRPGTSSGVDRAGARPSRRRGARRTARASCSRARTPRSSPPAARAARRRLPPRRQPGLPARRRREHDGVARLRGQLDVQHARQHRARPGDGPDGRRSRRPATTLYVTGPRRGRSGRTAGSRARSASSGCRSTLQSVWTTPRRCAGSSSARRATRPPACPRSVLAPPRSP